MKSNKLWNMMIMIVLMLSTTLAFSSCSKDDDEIEDANSLYGTKWQAEDWLYQSFWGGGKTYVVLDFNSKTTCELYDVQQGSVVYDCGKFSYMISDNKVTFKDLKDGDVSTYIIEGRNMKKEDSSNHIKGGISSTFVKQ